MSVITAPRPHVGAAPRQDPDAGTDRAQPTGRAVPATRRAPARRGPARPGRGTGRQARPNARPATVVPPPQVSARSVRRSGGQVRSCAVPVTSRWRLTDRGIATILVLGLMIVSAATVVVALTAVRVTGEGYQPPVITRLATVDGGPSHEWPVP
ncbi:MAG TPA: hypothetical protein VFP89_01495 [Propionibacteriaceae bacterium]|nr:hypothetical protein [Propionibacteriaceae bacterium]